MNNNSNKNILIVMNNNNFNNNDKLPISSENITNKFNSSNILFPAIILLMSQKPHVKQQKTALFLKLTVKLLSL